MIRNYKKLFEAEFSLDIEEYEDESEYIEIESETLELLKNKFVIVNGFKVTTSDPKKMHHIHNFLKFIHEFTDKFYKDLEKVGIKEIVVFCRDGFGISLLDYARESIGYFELSDNFDLLATYQNAYPTLWSRIRNWINNYRS